MQTADAIFQQASNMKENGLVAGIDVLRAEVQLEHRTAARDGGAERLREDEAAAGARDRAAARSGVHLVEELPYVPVPDMTLDAALERAYQTRPDYQAALERVRAAEATGSAVVGELLPSVQRQRRLRRARADARRFAHSTYALVGAVTVPIFNGGRTRGRLAEADADLRMRRAEAEDLKAGIYYDVKNGVSRSAGDQRTAAGRDARRAIWRPSS